MNKMGNYQTKDKVVVNENIANTAQVTNKLNMIGIVMVVIIVLLIMVIGYTLKQRCTKGVRKWLKKEMVASSITLPGIKVETIQPPQVNNGTSSSHKVVY